jgi:hypothetical protein
MAATSSPASAVTSTPLHGLGRPTKINTPHRGSAASQYMAAIVGYANAPLARATPSAVNVCGWNGRHSGALPGSVTSTTAASAETAAPATMANTTRRATTAERPRSQAAKKTMAPPSERRANLIAAARGGLAASAEAATAAIHSITARAIGCLARAPSAPPLCSSQAASSA